MKRKLISLLVAAAMVSSMAGCGSTSQAQSQGSEGSAAGESASQADEGGKTTIKWAVWDKDSTPYWSAMADAYMEKNPDVTVEMVDLGASDYGTVLATELSGDGSDFDVVSIKDVPGYATLVQKKAIAPLNDYIEKDSVDLSRYNGTTEQVTIDGNLYELPFRNDFWLIFYNKDIFDRANVSYPTNDMTWDEYDELARKVTNTTFGEQVYGAHYHTWMSTIGNLGFIDGKHSIVDGEYSCMKPFYDMVLAEEKDGVCRKYSDLKTEELHYSAAFSSGDTAMMNMGSWYISTLISNIKSGEYDGSLCGNWGMVKYPHVEGVEPGSTLGVITGLAVTTATDVPDKAWDFVKWASGEEGAEVMASTGNFPAIMTDEALKTITSLDGFPKDKESIDALEVSNLYLETPYAENVSEISSVLNTYHSMIMGGEISVDDGIEEMNKEVAPFISK